MTALPLTANRPLPRALMTGGQLPAWPVLWLLWGLPLWWLAGLFPFSIVIMAVPMMILMLQCRTIILVPGVLPWLVFIVWMIPSTMMSNDAGSLLSFGMRFCMFAGVAILLVYVINARDFLSPSRLLAALCAVWVWIILGGYLGMLWPNGNLTVTVGNLLPGGMMGNEYVRDLFFAPFADVQTPWGAEEPFNRPSAPFIYTNGWGAAIAMLTPVAVAAALTKGTKRAMIWLTVGLAASIPPAVASTNRGLFLTLIICVAYVVIRLAWRGNWKALLGVGLLSLVFGFILHAVGFLDDIRARQETANTTEGRSDLYTETFFRALESPILGYGAPRPSYTSEIYVGTQGMVWNVMFCFGIVGLVLFAVFLAGVALRTWAAPSTALLWLHASVIATCIMGMYYGLDRQLTFFAIVAGLLLRERYSPSSEFWPARMASSGGTGHA